MNFPLPQIPFRPEKPRQVGLTMVIDKGLSLTEAENLMDTAASYTDLVKFGFGTALLDTRLEEKIALYKSHNVRPYPGGTLFEAFVLRDRFDDYLRFIDRYEFDTVEVSDGTISLNHKQKCQYIETLARTCTVLSEVGTKLDDKVISNKNWVRMMKAELAAGAWKVIAEARESGSVGIYNKDKTANTALIEEIEESIDMTQVIWEAPLKPQQVWFIHRMGTNVSLGNISPTEVVALEALRLGLRGDTLFNFI